MKNRIQDEALQSIVTRAKAPANWNKQLFNDISDYQPCGVVWPTLQEHLSVDDYRALSDAFTKATRPGYKPERKKPCYVTLDEITEAEPEWLIPGYIPRYQITTISGDGGVGKSTLGCEIAAAVSKGRHSILVPLMEQKTTSPQEPGNVLMLSSEDSFEFTLKRRLKKYGADFHRIITVPVSNPLFPALKLGNPDFEDLIVQVRPRLLILDPLQSFIPPEINMGSRNAMRSCLNNLLVFGEKYGLTTLILCHTNKRLQAAGRDRIADSADLWDISRSVLIAGTVPDGDERYISQEKSNYAKLRDTVLYRLNDEQMTITGYTDQRDAYFQGLKAKATNKAPSACAQAEEYIMQLFDNLSEDTISMGELGKSIENAGISATAFRRAKANLIKSNRIRTFNSGYGKEKEFFVKKV